MVAAPSSWPLKAIMRMPPTATRLIPITAASVLVHLSSPGAPCRQARITANGSRSRRAVTTKFVRKGESAYSSTAQSMNSTKLHEATM